ncbi:MAG TPA: transposase, partial [Reyranella sp.]|nr:transposase [Reyranella sp.]
MTIIGIDVSKDWLDVAELDTATTTSRAANTADGIAALVTRLKTRAVTRIGLEATGAYHLPLLAAMLAAQLPVCLLNPAQIKAYRQDALLIAHYTQTHASELRPTRPTTDQQARLRELVGYWEGRVNERTRLLYQHDAACWAGCAAVQELLAADLAHVAQQLAAVEQTIATLLADLPEAAILQQIIGVGPRVAAIVLAYLQVELWGQVKTAAAYAGIHPRLEQWWRSSQRRLNTAGPPPLRLALYLAALVAIRHDAAIQQRYEHFLARGKAPKAALCAIGHA